jgi:hypothetical protein
MLCGRPPFDGEGEAAIALSRLQRDPLRPRQVRPSVPRSLEDVVGKAMARDPDDRFDSAAALRAALLAAGASPSADVDADVAPTSLTTVPAIPPPPQPTGAAVPGAPQPAAPAPSFRQTERAWLVPTLILVVIALALGVAGVLLGRSGAGDLFGNVRDAISGTPDPVEIQLTGAAAFDPPCERSQCTGSQRGGDDQENSDMAPLAIDDDPTTAWGTERYDNPDITVLKPGVGLVLSAEQQGKLDTLTIDSPSSGWSATFYVTGSDPGSLDGWGEPVATLDGIQAGDGIEVDLGGAEGGAVLVWITHQGDGERVEIAEARLTGVPE